MSQRIRAALLCVIVAIAFHQTFAAESEPLLGKPGKLLFEDDFARSAMSPKWRTGKGIWGEVRSLKVWEASAAPEWASRKSDVVAGLKK